MATLANEQRAHQSSELSSNSVNQKTWRIDHFEHIFNFSGCLFSFAKRSHYINIRFSWNFLRGKEENHSNLLEFFNRKGATSTHLLDFTFQNYENSSILLTNGFFLERGAFFSSQWQFSSDRPWMYSSKIPFLFNSQDITKQMSLVQISINRLLHPILVPR